MEGHELKQIRHQLGATQEQTASMLGVTKRGYQKWELGARRLPRHQQERVNTLQSIFTTHEHSRKKQVLLLTFQTKPNGCRFHFYLIRRKTLMIMP